MKKGTTGTHYKSDRKSKSFTIRLSEEDMRMIKVKADLLGVSMSEFIVSACAGKRVPGYKKPESVISEDLPGQIGIADFNFE